MDTLRAWRCYLHGRQFIIHTEHHPLRFPETQDHSSPRQVRWLERLVEFYFTIIPVKWKSKHAADALSTQLEDIPKNTEYSRDLLKNIMQKTFETNAISRTIADPSIIKRLVNEYAHDPEFENVYGNPADLFTLKNKLPYREGNLCIPRRQFRLNLLHDYHTTLSTRHLGKTKIRQRIQSYYYWKELRKSVQKLCEMLSHISAN